MIFWAYGKWGNSRCHCPIGFRITLFAGTVLVREWDEREYRVTVTADGLYELDGQRFKSLSAAARHITGTQWSGPKFFGLKAGKGGKR